MITRRALLLALGAAGAASPFLSRAQPSTAVRKIGFLAARSRSIPSKPDPYYDSFVLGMRELGYVEGQNLAIEWRFADGRYETLPDLAADLVRQKVEVIVSHSTAGTEAARRATQSIPIVNAASIDPVGSGWAASLARPGGNITGVANATLDLSSKHIEILKTLIPKLANVSILLNFDNATHAAQLKGYQASASRLGVKISPVEARSADAINRAFPAIKKNASEAVVVPTDAFYLGQRRQIAQLTLDHRLPSIFTYREEVEAGGLAGYGQSNIELYRRAATYVDKIFKGAKPGDLPIEQPTRFYLVLNRKTAKVLGLTIPNELLLRADELIG